MSTLGTSTINQLRPHTFTKTDASNFAIGGWLGQTDAQGKTIIVSYWSRKMIPAEHNYPVHEREFLALHEFVRKFRIYLHGVPFTAYVDHRSLEHMQDQPFLSPRQVHWVEFLSEFEFQVEYEPGARNTFADWLSRRPDYAKLVCPACEHSFDNGPHRVNTIQPADLTDLPQLDLNDIARLQEEDPFCKELSTWKSKPASIPSAKVGYFRSFARTDNIWRYKTAMIIPPGPLRLQLLQHFHDRLDHGHFGFKKTLESLDHLKYSKLIARREMLLFDYLHHYAAIMFSISHYCVVGFLKSKQIQSQNLAHINETNLNVIQSQNLKVWILGNLLASKLGRVLLY